MLLWLQLHKRYASCGKTFITNPFSINLFCQQKICQVSQSSTCTMKPKVTATFTEYCLIIVVNLFMTNATWIDRWSVRVSRIKNHRLVGRINSAVAQSHLRVHRRNILLWGARVHVWTWIHTREWRHRQVLRCHASGWFLKHSRRNICGLTNRRKEIFSRRLQTKYNKMSTCWHITSLSKLIKLFESVVIKPNTLKDHCWKLMMW